MHDLAGLNRLWLGAQDELGATRLLRRTLEVADPADVASASATLFADSNYHLWVNGAYLGRGPTFFHPHRRPIAQYDIKDRLRPGRNVVAALVHSVGIALHNYIPAGTPGLVARVDLKKADGAAETILPDAQWKVCAETGRLGDTPRRTWAIGFVECFDARAAPLNWQGTDFDDADWPCAEEQPPFPPAMDGRYMDPGLSPLRFTWQPVARILGRYATDPTPHPLSRLDKTSDYGTALMAEVWRPACSFRVGRIDDYEVGSLTVEGLSENEGAALCFDLGAQYVGAVSFEMTSESEGLIDVGWSELVENGRPQILRKGNSYADRYLARRGENTWFPIGLSSGRYLALVLRGFRGQVAFRRLGMLASEPAAEQRGAFECSRPRLNQIWDLCARTVRVGTQEGLMDCPTREQATYVGDGVPNARWFGRLTGDYSRWRHLLHETFAVQGEDGMVKTTVFSGIQHVLIDYGLLGIIGASDYVLETGDRETGCAVLPACRRLLGWYLAQRNREGLFDAPWELMSRHADWVQAPATAFDALKDTGYNLFIDHPGMGWHNKNDPGIDRRGQNAAINALLVRAIRTLASLLDVCGSEGREELLAEADRMAGAAGEAFWDPARGVFADGRLNGTLLSQISQQTNTWCAAAGFCDHERAVAALRRILRRDDAAMARSGPYFWYYMLPTLVEHGLAAEALDEVERLWSVMLDGGATTAWETFAGDDLDSYCHPWSSAPVDFLPRFIAGISVAPANETHIELRPQAQLLDWARARVMTPHGPIELSWRWDGPTCELSGSLPPDLRARVQLPTGEVSRQKGDWTLKVTVPGGSRRRNDE